MGRHMHLLQDKTLHGQNKYVAPAGATYFFCIVPTVGPYRDWHHGLRYVVPNRDWELLCSMSRRVNLTLTFGVRQ